MLDGISGFFFFTCLMMIICRPVVAGQLSPVQEAQALLLKYTNSLQIAYSEPQDKLANENVWEEYQLEFGKTYRTRAEREHRFRNFQINMYIAARFQRFEQGTALYGSTIFSDLSMKEIEANYLNYRVDNSTEKPSRNYGITKGSAPDRMDWRLKGAVTPVKFQGLCGSCWAFAVTGNVEGQWFLRKGQLVSLSEQELLDCNQDGMGCRGGDVDKSMKDIQNLGGLASEKDYPYSRRVGTSCRLKKNKIVAYINGSTTISSNEDDIADMLAAHGPIATGINAIAMIFYKGGISHPLPILCSPTWQNHAVLIVGYDISAGGEPYWIIKNCWSEDWGEKGYYLVRRGEGVCGLNRNPISAFVL